MKSFVSCFAIIFSIRTLCERAKHPAFFKKRSKGLQDLMFRKCYFQALEKSLTKEGIERVKIKSWGQFGAEASYGHEYSEQNIRTVLT